MDCFDSQSERECFSRFSKTISNNSLIIVGMQSDRECNAKARPGSGDRGTCLAWLISGCSRAAAENALQAMARVASSQDDEYVLGQNAVLGIIAKTDVRVETEFDDMDDQQYTHTEVAAALKDWIQLLAHAQR